MPLEKYKIRTCSGIYILAIPPPPGGGGNFCPNWKTEEFEEGLKISEEFEETSNKSPKKQGRFSTGGEQFFWLVRIYTPELA